MYTCPKQTSLFIKKELITWEKKIFNNLPTDIKNVADQLKKFKTALKQFCYTLE